MKQPGSVLRFTSVVIAVAAVGMAPAHADGLKARLDSLQENPTALSTPAGGTFRAKVDRHVQTIDFELNYAGIETGVQQAHIHFGRFWQNGGVSAFLCANGALKPRPTVPDCPLNAGTVAGVITAADVVGPAGQGIAAGEFAELAEAINDGATYVNVHSNAFPGGEIRGQIH